jgi:hypothetical protein
VRLNDVHDDPFGSATTLHGTLAALAAILPEEVGDRAKGLVVGAVVGELPLASDRDESGVHESIEVVVQSRPRDVEALLQVGRGHALWPGLYDGPQKREAGDVAEGSELFGVALDLTHVYVSSNIDVFVKRSG